MSMPPLFLAVFALPYLQEVPSIVVAWVASITTADVIKGLICFFVAALADAAWALYMRRSTTGHANHAAWFGVLLMAMGIFNTNAWLENKSFIPMILAGAWLGTYVTVRIDHRKGRTQQTAEMAVPGSIAGVTPNASRVAA